MAKFKKGDRVRVTFLYSSDERDGIEVDLIGTVDEDCICPYVLFDGKQGRYAMDEDQLELVAEPHVFKVGDRFRFVRDNSDGGGEFGKKGEEFVVSTMRGESRLTFIDPNRSWKPGAYVKDIELVEPAPEPEPEPVATPVPSLKASFIIPREVIIAAAEAHVKDVYGIVGKDAKVHFKSGIPTLVTKVAAR